MNQILTDISEEVRRLLGHDSNGHNMDHVERVLKMALSFAEFENADKDVVALAALLHDVDDYKIFGKNSADKLTNAKRILGSYDIMAKTKAQVLDIIRTMGYNKYLEGIRPESLEGKVVSDADMCDAIGSIGILRTHAYALSKGNEFFDIQLKPEEETMPADQYRAEKKSHSVQHFFDKLLKIPSILMTDSGKREGKKRRAIMVSFLEELFEEEAAPEWQEYLKQQHPL